MIRFKEEGKEVSSSKSEWFDVISVKFHYNVFNKLRNAGHEYIFLTLSYTFYRTITIFSLQYKRKDKKYSKRALWSFNF